MDLPKDLGQRIVEAARLAAMLHLQQSQEIYPVGGADRVKLKDGLGQMVRARRPDLLR